MLFITSCGSEQKPESSLLSTSSPADVSAKSVGDLEGTIEVDGSSTVYPISEAVAEEFNKLYPKVRVNVGVSGTGGGFKRFTTGETDISNASRHLKIPEETDKA